MRTLLTRLNRTAVSEYLGLAKVVEDANASDLLVAFALTPEREAGSIASTARKLEARGRDILGLALPAQSQNLYDRQTSDST